MNNNPVRVQCAPKDISARGTPLILIHDECGTTFGYFSLGKLNRDVWAIHNPNFFSAKPWKGGIGQMARHYVDLIENVGISGRILIGGKSSISNDAVLFIPVVKLLTARWVEEATL